MSFYMVYDKEELKTMIKDNSLPNSLSKTYDEFLKWAEANRKDIMKSYKHTLSKGSNTNIKE